MPIFSVVNLWGPADGGIKKVASIPVFRVFFNYHISLMILFKLTVKIAIAPCICILVMP